MQISKKNLVWTDTANGATCTAYFSGVTAIKGFKGEVMENLGLFLASVEFHPYGEDGARYYTSSFNTPEAAFKQVQTWLIGEINLYQDKKAMELPSLVKRFNKENTNEKKFKTRQHICYSRNCCSHLL